MNRLTILGVVLVVVAAIALPLGYVGHSETRPKLVAGPIPESSQEEHDFAISLLAGGVVLVGGLGLVVLGRYPA